MDISKISGANEMGIMWMRLMFAADFPNILLSDFFNAKYDPDTDLWPTDVKFFQINGHNAYNTVTFTEDCNLTDAGLAYQWKINLSLPKDRVEVTKALHGFMNAPLMAIVEDFNYQSRIVGDGNFPLQMKYGYSADPNRFEISLFGAGNKPAIYMQGDLTGNSMANAFIS